MKYYDHKISIEFDSGDIHLVVFSSDTKEGLIALGLEAHEGETDPVSIENSPWIDETYDIAGYFSDYDALIGNITEKGVEVKLYLHAVERTSEDGTGVDPDTFKQQKAFLDKFRINKLLKARTMTSLFGDDL